MPSGSSAVPGGSALDQQAFSMRSCSPRHVPTKLGEPAVRWDRRAPARHLTPSTDAANVMDLVLC